ncbi:LamB/YcsF family protein [Lederbergia lenta]|uniref:5-oxoprolinase subunit A n=1 Tax=Lederbergia lenta TaxID=1467 RepID=A0A2X4VQJ5_LEDLE|nr:5-oxoprolinase subunit PxpA [Lederbergia lenta]MEC2323601.1 LamB/YcsF family protein [Lederbergia lenta]SQI52519.1 LamB/YcsF family protein [Lederbergia lenta]
MCTIDLNCDMGESFGQYTLGQDEEMLRYISSANIACGFHAGDPSIMNKTVQLALKYNVSIGAHPGLPDLQGFGRRIMSITPKEAYELILYQTGALHAFVVANGGQLHHLKPHGALYNMAAVDNLLAEAIVEAAYHLNPEIILYGLSGSELIQAGNKIGLRTASEVFIDRTYQSDGTLTSRLQSNAVIKDVNKAISQALRMVKAQQVTSTNGTNIAVKADTICIHGDTANALDYVKKIHEAFTTEKIMIQAI